MSGQSEFGTDCLGLVVLLILILILRCQNQIVIRRKDLTKVSWVGCQVSCVRILGVRVSGVRVSGCQVSGVRYQVSGVRCLVHLFFSFHPTCYLPSPLSVQLSSLLQKQQKQIKEKQSETYSLKRMMLSTVLSIPLTFLVSLV